MPYTPQDIFAVMKKTQIGSDMLDYYLRNQARIKVSQVPFINKEFLDKNGQKILQLTESNFGITSPDRRWIRLSNQENTNVYLAAGTFVHELVHTFGDKNEEGDARIREMQFYAQLANAYGTDKVVAEEYLKNNCVVYNQSTKQYEYNKLGADNFNAPFDKNGAVQPMLPYSTYNFTYGTYSWTWPTQSPDK
jgi:hypothetical protein